MSKMSNIIYKVETYEVNENFIKSNGILQKNVTSLAKELKTNNKYYHFRIHKKTQYNFFGDLDGFTNSITEFSTLFSDFLKNYYNLDLSEKDIMYTQNSVDGSSYHYAIPKWNASTEKLKEIHANFIKKSANESNNLKKAVDTTIYSEHWFRCPNQSKGLVKGKRKDDNIHVIKKGSMNDFIIGHIKKNSIDINDVEFVDNQMEIVNFDRKKNKNSLEKYENRPTKYDKDDDQSISFSTTLSDKFIYIKIIDNCYLSFTKENYEPWHKIGMAFKNIFDDEEDGFELFDYFSSGANNYEGTAKTREKFRSFVKKVDGINVGTIYKYAIDDNVNEFIKIMSCNSIKMEQADIARYIKACAGNKFIYIESDSKCLLYCYNGKYWKNEDIAFRYFISEDLYDFIQNLLIKVYWNTKNFNQMKKSLERLKDDKFKSGVVRTYKEYGLVENMKFDKNWHLFGFNNLVYDLEQFCFREYEYDDYISITAGYDWREPTNKELATVNDLISKIMPIEDERELYLQILSTALDGRCLEKFIIFNGGGGNGKGMIDDLLLVAIGKHGLLANNSILFETGGTGSNPEKANIHKKRFVIFREPPARNKFQNAIVKELTGGGRFAARSHHEIDTEKILTSTMIVECNQRPLFDEEPNDSDVRRLIDIFFRSTFTTNESLLDDDNYIYRANPKFKTSCFQEKHKFALIRILLDAHKRYTENNYVFQIPESIEKRTNNYLELSCHIVQWFKDNYEFVNDNEVYSKVKDVYEDFTKSEFYFNISKSYKNKYNKKFFLNYVQTNLFFRKYYCEKKRDIRSFIDHWRKIESEDTEQTCLI